MNESELSRHLLRNFGSREAVLRRLNLPASLAQDSAVPMRPGRGFDQELNGLNEEELAELLQAVQRQIGDRKRGRDRISPDRDWVDDARKQTYDRLHREADDKFNRAFPKARDLAVGPQEATGGQGISPRDQTGESPWQGEDRHRGRYGMDSALTSFSDRFPDSKRIQFW